MLYFIHVKIKTFLPFTRNGAFGVICLLKKLEIRKDWDMKLSSSDSRPMMYIDYRVWADIAECRAWSGVGSIIHWTRKWTGQWCQCRSKCLFLSTSCCPRTTKKRWGNAGPASRRRSGVAPASFGSPIAAVYHCGLCARDARNVSRRTAGN